MLKNNFLGVEVSRLGFGAMRLPVIDGDQGNIDIDQLEKMVDLAISEGVNYFDTAYPYHNNLSEKALGKVLLKYPRESFYLATKYPGHQITDNYDPQPIFEEQLEKCQVDYFDFYLLHNVYENSIDVYTNEEYGIVDYLIDQKKAGRIRRLGFSSHGRPENLSAFLDYGARKYEELEQKDPDAARLFSGRNIMEFCQIQLNYLDWKLQRADEKCAILEDLGIPVIVMEPLRGGKLVELEKDQMKNLRNSERGADAEMSAVEWSFRWLQAIPNVKVILSGMSNLQQVEENCQIFDDARPLSEDEMDALADVAAALSDGVPCTACRYCCDSCPQGIDIPTLLAMYNDMKYATSFTIAMQIDAIPEGQKPQDCLNCGACIAMCPQGIDVPSALYELAEKLEGIPKWADICKQREAAAAASRE